MAPHGYIRIFIVDDHAAIRRGLRHILAPYADIAVVGEAADAAGALATVADLSPDVILLDVRLPDASGFELAVRLRKVAPTARILILASLDDDRQLANAMPDSVDGFIQKREADVNLADAIRAIMQGVRWPVPRVQVSKALGANIMS